MKHCGNENCQGASCENWPKCKGETIPPWDCGPHESTAQQVFREQDILAEADNLADHVSSYLQKGLVQLDGPLDAALKAYHMARRGERGK